MQGRKLMHQYIETLRDMRFWHIVALDNGFEALALPMMSSDLTVRSSENVDAPYASSAKLPSHQNADHQTELYLQVAAV